MPKFVINTHSTTESLNEMLDVIHPKCYKYNSKNKAISFEIYGTVELDYKNLVCRMEIKEFEE